MYGVSVEGYKKTNNRINTFVSCGQQKVYQVDKKEARHHPDDPLQHEKQFSYQTIIQTNSLISNS